VFLSTCGVGEAFVWIGEGCSHRLEREKISEDAEAIKTFNVNPLFVRTESEVTKMLTRRCWELSNTNRQGPKTPRAMKTKLTRASIL
jgi:hypothetical protein